jgi:hypothetical protein
MADGQIEREMQHQCNITALTLPNGVDSILSFLGQVTCSWQVGDEESTLFMLSWGSIVDTPIELLIDN